MTRIGHRNRFGAASHVGHDGRVGDECVLGDGVLLGGHCTLGDGVYLAGNSAVHQGIRIGRLARLEVCATTTKDMPPFLRQGRINAVLGINEDGMRQAGLTEAEIDGVRRAFAILFSGSTLPAAVFRIEEELPPSPALHELITFLASCTRGINRPREAAAETPARAAVPVA
jgi:UDP-N-acetylglucosamine acyltransferase